jgi:plastocyanin
MKTIARSRAATPLFAAWLALAHAVSALTIPSDGSDGTFAPSANIVMDLSKAVTGTWDQPGNGNGTYDPNQWAVVFKFSSVNIPAGVTVTFTNHPSRAPVIWLVQGAVSVAGTVSLNGQAGHAGNLLRSFAEPGPGGFRGGRGSDAATPGSGGLGPGASSYGITSNHASSGAGYGTAGQTAFTTWGGLAPGTAGSTYGNEGVFPLIGGSGAAGSADDASGKGGGAGGGAILIATPGSFLLNGQIVANGGAGTAAGGSGASGTNRCSGGGSGGGIRIIANNISGNGGLRALGGNGGTGSVSTNGGNGGLGRIRVEANTNSLVDLGNPAFSLAIPQDEPRIFRDPTTPSIRSISLNGQTIPEDPQARLAFPDTDLTLPLPGTATLVIHASHVPLDGGVDVNVVRRSGVNQSFAATLSEGTFENSVWTAQVDIAGGFSTVQVHARFPASP